MRRGVASASVGAVMAALLTACTGGGETADGPSNTGDSTAGGPITTASAPTSPPTSDAGTPTTTNPAVGGATQPLVVISNVHRPRLDLNLSEARALAAGHPGPALGAIQQQVGGRVSLYRSSAHPVAVVARDRSTIAVVPADEVRPTVRTALVDGVDPLLRPDLYELTTEADQPVPTVTTLRFVGDIMLGRGVATANAGNPGRTLRSYAPLLRSADLTVGNLESTLSADGRPRQGDDSFAADPSVVPALERAGFDVLSLANNHTGDFGPHALRQTVARLDASRIARVGAGRDAADAWAPVVLRRNGLTFGFLAFNAIGETPRATADSPGAAEIRMQPRLGPLNHDDLNRMTASVHQLAQQVDVVTVVPHWGDQYNHRAVPDQRKVARALVDAGADLVVGSHPHWVQGMASRGQSVVAYSLGNFVFDMDWEHQTMEGVSLDVTFWGDRLMAAVPEPYVLGAQFSPHPATGDATDRILTEVWRFSFGVFKGRELSPQD